MIIILVICLLVIADQFIKIFVINNIQLYQSNPVIDGFFYLTHTTNKGAAWSILQNMNIIFVPTAIITCAILLFFVYKYRIRILSAAGTLIVAGAIGNLIDRIFRPDGVVDYLEFHFGSYIFPIFNLADCLLVCGSILLGYYILFIYGKKKVDENDESN